jgi:hypothetical protein
MQGGIQLERLSEIYQETFLAIDGDREPPPVEVSFYPYVGINHTIRLRGGTAFVRIAEICRQMPLDVHRGLAFILVSKLFRRRVPKWANDVYSDYQKSPELRELAAENRRQKGRKVVTTHVGEHFDLAEIFDRLNRTYFAGRLPQPVLTWSARKTYRILGHHDSTHETIVVSRSLDDKSTPPYVVDYVVFHEMLHIHHPTVHHNGRRYNHVSTMLKGGSSEMSES